MWGGKRFKCGGVEGMIILSKALIWFWESKEEDGIVVDALHAAKWEYKANLQYIVLTRHVTCNQNKHWCSCTRNVAVHMYVTHHIKQQVALPGPCNLKLNWACTLWSCSPHTELCLLLSMWMHLPVSTLLPWSRHMPSPIQSLWIPLHCTLAVAGSFRMKGLAQCAVAYRLQDLHLPWWGRIDRFDHRQERRAMIDCQLVMEGFMRVPVTLWTAVIWFKLLKEERPAERERERAIKKRRSVLQRETAWGGFVPNRSLWT